MSKSEVEGWPARVVDLTKREYYAAMAMQALIEHLKTFHDKCETVEKTEKMLAVTSFRMADAMIRES